jgi:hypothetical protein
VTYEMFNVFVPDPPSTVVEKAEPPFPPIVMLSSPVPAVMVSLPVASRMIALTQNGIRCSWPERS